MQRYEAQVPRLMLGGTASGSGKTTVTCAVLQALVDDGLRVAGFKCGPDYIDPMFHSEVIGIGSRNLDVMLSGEDGVRFLLARSASGCSISVIEGVMGIYDGQGFDSDYASTNHISRLTQSPLVLIVNVRGMGRSLGALLHGYLSYADNLVRGVIFNNCSAGMYPSYQKLAQEAGVTAYGFLPPVPQATVESRHLGLVTAQELSDLKERLSMLAQAARQSVDLEGLIQLAHTAPPLSYPDLWEDLPRFAPVRIGIARDRAFSFYYQDNLDLLQRLGAQLCAFSPLDDASLPPDLDGLWLCGGYPEEYAAQLSQNRTMRESVRAAVAGGLPTVAECGGFMYLLERLSDRKGKVFDMAGVLPGESHMTSGLTRFGYQTLTARRNNLFCAQGERLTAHEFHYSDSSNNGDGFDVCKRERSWQSIHTSKSLFAGYPHFHLGAHPRAMQRFVAACAAYRDCRTGLKGICG